MRLKVTLDLEVDDDAPVSEFRKDLEYAASKSRHVRKVNGSADDIGVAKKQAELRELQQQIKAANLRKCR